MVSTPRVAIIGAGLAGLSAARVLNDNDVDVTLYEATDDVGGRVRSNIVDGYILDEGFQVFNPAYPTARALLHYESLSLRSFEPGVSVISDAGDMLLINPLKSPLLLPSMLKNLRYPKDLARFALYALSTFRESESEPDLTALDALRKARMTEPFIWNVLNPFLQGVFLDSSLSASKDFLDFVLRYFVLGKPALPARGMQEIPRNLASTLKTTQILLKTPVESITDSAITTHRGIEKFDKIIVATDSDFVAQHFGLDTPPFHHVTTWYHTTDIARSDLANGKGLLRVDSDRLRGPVINSVVLSHVSSAYAPSGQHLISSSTLSMDCSHDMEISIRKHLSALYRTNTDQWDLVGFVSVPKALNFSTHKHGFESKVSDNVFLAGDWRMTTSIEGAMASGVSAAQSLLKEIGRYA